MRSFTTAIAAFSLACAIGCGSSATSPSPNGTPAALIVSGSPAATSTFQLTATARLSDGATRDVTTSAQWETSNRSVAMISATGMVTVIATGQVEFRATYLGVAGSLQLLLTAPTHGAFTLSGIVREVAPNQRTLGGAQVSIITGPDAGRTATSDASGFYQLTGVSAGTVSVVTTLDGFDPYRAGVSITGNMESDGWLAPVPPTSASGSTATARCKDGTWSWAQTQADACADNGGMAYPVCPGPFCRDLTASVGRQ